MKQEISKLGKISIYLSLIIIFGTLASWVWMLTFIGSTGMMAGMEAVLAFSACIILYIVNLIVFFMFFLKNRYNYSFSKQIKKARLLVIVIPILMFLCLSAHTAIQNYNSDRETQDLNSTYDSTPFR